MGGSKCSQPSVVIRETSVSGRTFTIVATYEAFLQSAGSEYGTVHKDEHDFGNGYTN